MKRPRRRRLDHEPPTDEVARYCEEARDLGYYVWAEHLDFWCEPNGLVCALTHGSLRVGDFVPLYFLYPLAAKDRWHPSLVIPGLVQHRHNSGAGVWLLRPDGGRWVTAYAEPGRPAGTPVAVETGNPRLPPHRQT